jgi:hypothetical protein
VNTDERTRKRLQLHTRERRPILDQPHVREHPDQDRPRNRNHHDSDHEPTPRAKRCPTRLRSSPYS